MITDYMKQIAYNEGKQAFRDGVLYEDNPYEGVSVWSEIYWSIGWISAQWGWE